MWFATNHHQTDSLVECVHLCVHMDVTHTVLIYSRLKVKVAAWLPLYRSKLLTQFQSVRLEQQIKAQTHLVRLQIMNGLKQCVQQLTDEGLPFLQL